jgi:DNA mismatch repair ATPase MutL
MCKACKDPLPTELEDGVRDFGAALIEVVDNGRGIAARDFAGIAA